MKSKSYFHYIVIIEVDENDYAYHYSSSVRADVSAHIEQLDRSIGDVKKLYGMHMLKTNDKSFESVQKMDPYFEGMIITEDTEEFSKKYRYYIEHLNLHIGIS
ncbi:hypothetical protein FD03_GL001364 [Companilactobacillus nodensis DSM 19682 = JCM 14932 = NBRC 107160]|uniref:Uncharacterized protein n=1 Tax=Companilactobacillus nodensis DSM 19682 = JCM 14932 = NBRC 107160 TaxID=1423775 RepID=A0A0R1K6Q4_9LACO|nr:hypothetical protein [Companilactobacillus nodensis]KRK79003.1 hypothetical protein FD03_GL001364 [Companilactobacillus nodensis DSM 19682 = JCM 14932 = NBRC 107160]